ncbi:MAG: hypothetical protein WBA77_16920 [Microcoleaceae cyanobacterium]
MIQFDPYNALKKAKTGNPEAIQTLINHLLKDQDFQAKVLLKNDAVHVFLESENTISQPVCTLSIVRILNKINAPYLNTAVIQAKIKGKVNPIWTECVQLNTPPEAEVPQTKKKKTSSSFYWPAWFPYPSSWLRSVILLLWIGVIVRIFGFWGVFLGGILSLISDNPFLFLLILGVSLLASCLALSYLYHLIDLKKSSRWFPRPIKLWEGIYAPIVLIVSIIIVVILCFPFVPLNECTLSSATQSSYCRRILDDYYQELDLYATGVWLLSILYLYQIEYLLRLYFPFKKFLKFATIGFVTVFILVNIQITLKNWDYIYGAITALATPTTEQINPVHSTTPPTTTEPVNTTVIPTEAPKQSTETVPTITEPVNTTVIQTEAPKQSTETVKIDPFKAAVNQAIIAAELTQSAQDKLQWQQVANHWESALNLMKVVPSTHPHYAIARDRVIQYQKNLDYANKNIMLNQRQSIK